MSVSELPLWFWLVATVALLGVFVVMVWRASRGGQQC